METKSELLVVDGVEVRKVKHGIYVREDEWQQYLEFNKPLNLSYMFKHEPFKELPEAYIPSPEYDHYPPTLIFGFPISRDFKEFRQIALAEGLISAEEPDTSQTFIKIRLLVLRHINKQCDLKPGSNIFGTGVSSLSTNFVLELRTNYEQLIPEDKMDEVMRVLKKYLPETEPQWYLEADIDLKHIRASPMSMFDWAKPPGVSFTYSHVVALNEVAPFRT